MLFSDSASICFEQKTVYRLNYCFVDIGRGAQLCVCLLRTKRERASVLSYARKSETNKRETPLRWIRRGCVCCVRWARAHAFVRLNNGSIIVIVFVFASSRCSCVLLSASVVAQALGIDATPFFHVSFHGRGPPLSRALLRLSSFTDALISLFA